MHLPEALKKYIKSNKAVHHMALQAYSLTRPPPYLQANMEFEADAWNGISSLYYQGGRQLGEDNSGPYPYREITHNRYETCKFKDTRLGLPMNVTNLQLVMPYAADAYRLTTALRNRYIEERNLSPGSLNLIQAYLLSKLSASIPAFLVRRRDSPVRSGQIETLEAAFYMLGAAPFILVRQLMARGDRAPLDDAPKSGSQLYLLSSDSRTLISNRECACPAAPKLIIEYFDVIMSGSYDGPLDSLPVQRVLGRIADWHRLYAYTLASSRLDLLVLLNRAITLRCLYRLRGESAQRFADVARQLQLKHEGALALSHVKQPGASGPVAAIDVAIEVLSALLRDHGDAETLDELGANAALLHDSNVSMTASDAATSIRAANNLIHRSCQRDLQLIHSSLGNRRWPSISPADLLLRTGGAEFAAQLGQLESTRVP